MGGHVERRELVHLPFLGVGPGVVEPSSPPPWTPEEGPPMLVDNALLCQQWQRQLPQGRPQMVMDERLMLYAAWVASDYFMAKCQRLWQLMQTGKMSNGLS